MLGHYLTFIISALLAAGFAISVAGLARVRDVAGFLVAGMVGAAASVVLITELLSIVNLWKPAPLLLLQAVALAAVAVPARSHGDFCALRRLRDIPRVFTIARAKRNPVLVAGLALLTIVVSVELVMAIGVAPNTWDSMTYHLTRIVYWMQNSSATQFPGATERQAAFPPNVEILQGWTMLITRGDRLVQTVQWTAQLGILCFAWALARDLGFSRRQSALPLLAIVAMPVVVAQATNTQNDLTTTFLLCGALLFVLRGVRSDRGAAILAGAAGGLAFGAKSSSGGSLLAVGIGAAVQAGRQWRALIVPGVALIVGVLLLGSLNYGQNLSDRGSFAGAPGFDQYRVHSLKEVPNNAVGLSWQAVASVPGGDWAAKFVWPFEHAYTRFAGGLGSKLSGVKNPGYAFDYGRIEDRVGVGLPFLLLILPALLWCLVRPPSREVFAVALTALAAWAVVVLTLRMNPWTARFMIVPAAFAAPLTARFGGSRIVQAFATLLLIGSFVGIGLHATYKPLLSPTGSVLRWDRVAQITAVNPPETEFLSAFEAAVPEHARVGFVGMGDSYEYPFAGPHFDRTLVKLSPQQLAPGVFELYDLDAIVVTGLPGPQSPIGTVLYNKDNHQLIVPK